jgi:hypothetical protein
MLTMGFCTGVLIHEPEEESQAGTVLGIHLVQFLLGLVLWPVPSLSEHVLNTYAMATDMLPLIVAVMPVGNCGVLPVGTQMLLLAAALMDTTQRIVVLMTDLLPKAVCLLVTVLLYLVSVLMPSNKKEKEKETKKKPPAAADDKLGDPFFVSLNETFYPDGGPAATSSTDEPTAPATKSESTKFRRHLRDPTFRRRKTKSENPGSPSPFFFDAIIEEHNSYFFEVTNEEILDTEAAEEESAEEESAEEKSAEEARLHPKLTMSVASYISDLYTTKTDQDLTREKARGRTMVSPYTEQYGGDGKTLFYEQRQGGWQLYEKEEVIAEEEEAVEEEEEMLEEPLPDLGVLRSENARLVAEWATIQEKKQLELANKRLVAELAELAAGVPSTTGWTELEATELHPKLHI